MPKRKYDSPEEEALARCFTPEEFDDMFDLAFRMLWPKAKPCEHYETLMMVILNDLTWKRFLEELDHLRSVFYVDLIRDWTERIEASGRGNETVPDPELKRLCDELCQGI
jgi:hypothetical protein